MCLDHVCEQCSSNCNFIVGPWDYGVLEGRQVDRWLASRAGWRADVLRDRTEWFIVVGHMSIKLKQNHKYGQKTKKEAPSRPYKGHILRNTRMVPRWG